MRGASDAPHKCVSRYAAVAELVDCAGANRIMLSVRTTQALYREVASVRT